MSDESNDEYPSHVHVREAKQRKREQALHDRIEELERWARMSLDDLFAEADSVELEAIARAFPLEDRTLREIAIDILLSAEDE